MKRSTFRAWKCRLGVHRFYSYDDVKCGYICKDCRIDLGALAPKAPFMFNPSSFATVCAALAGDTDMPSNVVQMTHEEYARQFQGISELNRMIDDWDGNATAL